VYGCQTNTILMQPSLTLTPNVRGIGFVNAKHCKTFRQKFIAATSDNPGGVVGHGTRHNKVTTRGGNGKTANETWHRRPISNVLQMPCGPKPLRLVYAHCALEYSMLFRAFEAVIYAEMPYICSQMLPVAGGYTTLHGGICCSQHYT
jgi:hypothetical protein